MMRHRTLGGQQTSPSVALQHKRKTTPHAQRRLLQRAVQDRSSLSAGQILQLQRLVGNRATGDLLGQPVQTKLLLGPADDPYERQADQVAQVAVRGAGTAAPSTISRLPGEIQLASLHGAAGGEVDPQVARSIEAQRGGGQPLAKGVVGSMGRVFDTDFSPVRVHTGANAEGLNRSLNAKAFTTGNDIFFGKGQYNPQSTSGQELIAHELTHVVQQNGGGDVQRQFVIRRDFLVQRDDEPGLVSSVTGGSVSMGDIGGAIVQVYDSTLAVTQNSRKNINN